MVTKPTCLGIFKPRCFYGRREKKAVTMLEIAMTMTIAFIMMGAAAYYYGGAIEKSKASALKQTLVETRKAIDAYYKNNEKYPEKLEDLVNGQYVYLRSVPTDPVTGVPVWLIIKENGHTAVSSENYTGPVYDIKSLDPRYYNL